MSESDAPEALQPNRRDFLRLGSCAMNPIQKPTRFDLLLSPSRCAYLNSCRFALVVTVALFSVASSRGEIPAPEKIKSLNELAKPAPAAATTVSPPLVIPYRGVPYWDERYKGGPQVIPGKLQNEYYDTLDITPAQKAAGGGEKITYHDTDNKNDGSGGLNGRGNYHKEFRISESPDISYTKFNNPGNLIDDSSFNLVMPEPDSLYLGWIAPGEWVKYTVEVQTEGDYTLNILFTSKFGGHISFDSDGADITGPLAIPVTANATDPIEWRKAHHWAKINNLGKFHLKKGRQVLTLHFKDKPVMNFDYMEFVLLK
jgi:hypothetical protein